MKNAKNLVITFLSAAASIALPMIAIPIYAKNLGPSMWGFFSVILLVQLGATLLEQGYSQAVMKELAVLRKEQAYIYTEVFERLKRQYIAGGVTIAILVGMSPIFFIEVSTKNLVLDNSVIVSSFAFLGIILAFQLTGALFRAVLLGCEQHAEIGIINISIQLLRYGGGVLLILWKNQIDILLFWYMFCVALDTFAKYLLMPKVNLVKNPEDNERIKLIRAKTKIITSNSLKMSIAVLLGALTVYMDRFMVGKILPMEDLGIYTLASTAAMGTLQMVYPLGQILLPKLISTRDHFGDRGSLNIKVSKYIALIIFIFGTVFMVFGEEVVSIWLRDRSLVNSVFPLLEILLVGSIFNAIFNIGYWNWLADGQHKLISICFSACAIFSLILTPYLTTTFGLQGAALGWALSNLVCLLFSLGWIKNIVTRAQK